MKTMVVINLSEGSGVAVEIEADGATSERELERNAITKLKALLEERSRELWGDTGK